MTENSKSAEQFEIDVNEVKAAFKQILEASSANLSNLSWSEDKRSMTIGISLFDNNEGEPTTYDFLSHLVNYPVEALIQRLAADTVKQSMEAVQTTNQATEQGESNESKGTD